MKYCQHCGQQLNDNAIICPKCGCAVSALGLALKEKRYYSAASYDEPSTGMWWLGFLIPIAGLIYYLVVKDERPQRASSAGGGALAGILLNLLITVIIIILNA